MVAVGDAAPDFTLKDQNGNDVTLSEFRGTAGGDRLLPVHVHRRVRGRALRDPRRPVGVRARRRAGAGHLVRLAPLPAHVGRAAGLHVPGAERLLAARRGGARPTACSTTRSAARTAPRFVLDKDGVVSSTFASPDLGTPRAKAEYEDAFAKVS